MSYTRLRYHIVTATKHRDRVITPAVEAIIYPALQQKALELGGKVLSVGGVEDHIHLVAAIPPTVAVATFVQRLKAVSTRAVNEAEVVEGQFAWQEGYRAFTLNPLDLEAVLRYVGNQKAHSSDIIVLNPCSLSAMLLDISS